MIYKLLLVDDEKPSLDKMCYNNNWAKEGYKVFPATNGKDALAIIKREGIDILVTDIRMPKLDGMELIEKSKKINKDLKIIVISGFAEFKYAQKSIDLGVSHYLLKPFSSKKIRSVVNEAKELLSIEKNDKFSTTDLRNEILESINKKQVDGIYNFIKDGQFYRQQITILEDIELDDVLSRGSKELVLNTANKIISRLSKEFINKEEYMIVFNNLILESYKIIKEFGFRVEDLLLILNAAQIKKINNSDLKKMEVLIKDFLINIHELISFNYKNKNQELVGKIKDYISNNYQHGVTLNEIAGVFNFSTSYLSNLFYEETGEHFTNYMNMIRLKKAKYLLRATNLKIYEIADQLGFNDGFYFSTWFKKLVGSSPTIYRENIDLLG